LSWLNDIGNFSIRNFSFPDLIDIRDFLKIHHISNALSIGDLFPNLAVIRGKKLNGKYALQIASCSRLEKVGLSGLRFIGGGNIQIKDNNKHLCFSDTIDWTAIAPNSSSNNIEASSLLKFTCRKQFVIHNKTLRVRLTIATRLASLMQSSVGNRGSPSRSAIRHVRRDSAAPAELVVGLSASDARIQIRIDARFARTSH
jgi:Receptor L domain